MEHRWGHRVTTDISVQVLADASSAGWGRLRNISISGGFVKTALRIRVLSTLRVTIPATAGNPVRTLQAIVVRSEIDGVGVEWLDPELEAVITLVSGSERAITRRAHTLTRTG